MTPSWVEPYIGLPFEHYNCWQLICKVYREQLSIRLPFLDARYTDPYDKDAIADIYADELARVWQKIDGPDPFCCIVFRIQGLLWHVGLTVDRRYMLHTHDRIDAAIECFTNSLWRRRIEGFYTYVG